MLNKIMVIGHAGGDPVMRYTAKGDPVTTFRIATGRTYTTATGEKRDETEWFSVVTYRRLAEQVNEYLRKGNRAYVEGRFQSRPWTAQDGTQRTSNEIVADRVLFLERRGAAEGPGASEAGGDDVARAVEADDLPF